MPDELFPITFLAPAASIPGCMMAITGCTCWCLSLFLELAFAVCMTKACKVVTSLTRSALSSMSILLALEALYNYYIEQAASIRALKLDVVSRNCHKICEIRIDM